MNTSNCKACVWRHNPGPGAHCYMFLKEPSTPCRQWKRDLLPETTPIKRIELERSR